MPDWGATLKADDLASLGPQGMVLEARQLTVREMPSRTKQKRGWFELEALGNVVAEGRGVYRPRRKTDVFGREGPARVAWRRTQSGRGLSRGRRRRSAARVVGQ